MAKTAYIGVSDKARQIKNILIGVGDKARQVMKAYVGVVGVARLWWEYVKIKIPVVKSSTSLSLHIGRADMIGVSTTAHAIFAGDFSSTNSVAVDAFNSSLTRTVPTDLPSTVTSAMRGGSTGNNAVYVYYYYNAVAYNTSLAQTILTNITLPAIDSGSSMQTREFDGTTFNSRAVFHLFAVGYTYVSGSGTSYYTYHGSLLWSYNNSLTLTTHTGLANYASYVNMGANASYLIFTSNNSTVSQGLTSVPIINAYNTSFTRTSPGNLYTGYNGYVSVANTSEYVIFMHRNTPPTVYNRSLVRTTLTASTPMFSTIFNYSQHIANLKEYVLFSNHITDNDGANLLTYVYTPELVFTTLPAANSNSTRTSAATIGNYALIAGGDTVADSTKHVTTVTAYQYTG
jgi:hypothetical protein